MARVYTIESIEGNSNLGVPVFSRQGLMSNINYIDFSPTREPRPPRRKGPHPVSVENLKFELKPAFKEIGARDQSAQDADA
jgi:hypothetical protein